MATTTPKAKCCRLKLCCHHGGGGGIGGCGVARSESMAYRKTIPPKIDGKLFKVSRSGHLATNMNPDSQKKSSPIFWSIEKKNPNKYVFCDNWGLYWLLDVCAEQDICT